MTQATSLPDTLLSSSSLLGGLLSQMNNAFGSGAQNGMFASLLSQDGDLQASLDAMAKAAPPATSTPSSSASSAPDLSSPTSLDQVIHNVSDLASALRQVLHVLRQQNGGASSFTANPHNGAKNQATAQATTKTTVTDTQTGAASTQTTPSQTSTDATDSADTTVAVATTDDTSTSPTDPAQTIADIISELLAVAQLILHKLQQVQQAETTGGASTKLAIDAAAAANDMTSGNADGTTGKPVDPLMQLLQAIEQNAKELLAVVTDPKAGATPTTTLAAATLATTASSQLAQLSQLDAQLKGAFAALKQQTQNALATQPTNVAIQAALQAPITTTPKNSDNDQIAKAATSDNWQNQFFSTPAQQTNAAPATPQAQTYTAEAVVASASAKDNANSGANPDLMSGGNNNSSFSATPTVNLGSGMSAGGANATGTYSFTSTLSAFRAANGGNVGLPSVVDQVILQMNRGVKTGDGIISIQLTPADLGKINVKLNIDSDGKVQGTVTTSNPQTLSLLQKDSRSLERALQDAGLSADPGSLQFSLNGQSQQNNAGNTSQNADKGGSGSGDGTISAGDMTGIADIGGISETYYLTPDGVNIQV